MGHGGLQLNQQSFLLHCSFSSGKSLHLYIFKELSPLIENYYITACKLGQFVISPYYTMWSHINRLMVSVGGMADKDPPSQQSAGY